MTEAVVAALIGIGGAVLVAIAGAITQVCTTKRVVEAERQRIDVQLRGEEAVRQRERREERLVAALSALLAASDPQIAPGGDYGQAVRLIHRMQLLLDLDDPLELKLNGSLNRLGERLQSYVVVRENEIDDKIPQTVELLKVHSEIATLGHDVVRAVVK